MTEKSAKPLYSEDFICPVCGTSDTVTLYIPGDDKPDFVMWCSEGHVTVRHNAKEQQVYKFE